MKTPYDLPEGADYQEYLRYYYAGIAMQGLIVTEHRGYGENLEKTVKLAVQAADALIKELAK
jgi:hypothetical protein